MGQSQGRNNRDQIEHTVERNRNGGVAPVKGTRTRSVISPLLRELLSPGQLEWCVRGKNYRVMWTGSLSWSAYRMSKKSRDIKMYREDQML